MVIYIIHICLNDLFRQGLYTNHYKIIPYVSHEKFPMIMTNEYNIEENSYLNFKRYLNKLLSP